MMFTSSVRLVLIFYILSSLVPPSKNESISVEDLYDQTFPIDPKEYQYWPYAQKWSQEPNRPTLKRFCAAAHEAAGKGPCNVNLVLYQMRWLSFVNTTHPDRHIDMLEYGCQDGAEPAHIEDYWMLSDNEDDRWYITRGTKSDCVFYLANLNTTVEYIIDRHVCGAKINETYALTEDGGASEKL